MKAFRAVISAVLLSLSLSGCVSLSEFFASFGFGESEKIVDVPNYRVGDSFTFGNPIATWRVVSVEDRRVTWRSDTGNEQITGRNPLLPALSWRSEKVGSGQRIISDQMGSLFPMKVGARTTFRAAVTTDKPPYGWSFDWQCVVIDRQEIAGPTGAIDAFKVACGRDIADEIVFFYAPTIGHYITKTSNAEGEGAARIKHLIAYEKINSEGRLERVTFAGRPLMQATQAQPQKLAAEISNPRIKFEEVGGITRPRPAHGNTLQNRARQLLAQRKSVQAPVDTTAVINARKAPPRDIASMAPASGGGDTIQGAAQKGPRFQLVAKTLPHFPPRPKANPKRESMQLESALANLPTLPVIPNSVAEIPALPSEAKRNPFDVSIVKIAYAAPEADNAALRRARKRAIRTPGLGDEAMLSVRSNNARSQSARASVSPRGLSKQFAERPSARNQVASLPAPSAKTDTGERFYGLHLGTFLGPRKALQGWKYIFRSHQDLLTGLQPRIRRHDLGKNGVRYRLRVVPFANAASATALCERLSKRGKFCRVTSE